MDAFPLQWLHPDGRVGGRGPDGKVRWYERELVGARVDVDGNHLADAPHQRPAPCPHSERCGGCDLDRWGPEARREALAAMVGRAYDAEPPELVPSPSEHGTRARIKLTLQGGVPGYRAHRSHDHVPVHTCGVARPEVQEALHRLRATSVDPGFASVEIRGDGQRAIYAFTRADPRARLPVPDLPDVAIDGRPVRGDPTLRLTVLGQALRASPLSFYQVNLDLNELLVGFVRDELVARRPERVLDLYAGIGNFTLPLAATGVPVEAVEMEGQATADLQAMAPPTVQVQLQRVEAFDPGRCAFDALVLDPPRAGAGKVMDRVLRSRPRVIAHVACDPVAGARDVRRALSAGYRLAALRCFDLFPGTRHVETVAILDRR